MIESELRERKFAPGIRLEVAATMGKLQSGMLVAELGLNEEQDVFVVDQRMAMTDLFQIAAIARSLSDLELNAPLYLVIRSKKMMCCPVLPIYSVFFIISTSFTSIWANLSH